MFYGVKTSRPRFYFRHLFLVNTLIIYPQESCQFPLAYSTMLGVAIVFSTDYWKSWAYHQDVFDSYVLLTPIVHWSVSSPLHKIVWPFLNLERMVLTVVFVKWGLPYFNLFSFPLIGFFHVQVIEYKKIKECLCFIPLKRKGDSRRKQIIDRSYKEFYHSTMHITKIYMYFTHTHTSIHTLHKQKYTSK